MVFSVFVYGAVGVLLRHISYWCTATFGHTSNIRCSSIDDELAVMRAVEQRRSATFTSARTLQQVAVQC